MSTINKILSKFERVAWIPAFAGMTRILLFILLLISYACNNGTSKYSPFRNNSSGQGDGSTSSVSGTKPNGAVPVDVNALHNSLFGVNGDTGAFMDNADHIAGGGGSGSDPNVDPKYGWILPLPNPTGQKVKCLGDTTDLSSVNSVQSKLSYMQCELTNILNDTSPWRQLPAIGILKWEAQNMAANLTTFGNQLTSANLSSVADVISLYIVLFNKYWAITASTDTSDGSQGQYPQCWPYPYLYPAGNNSGLCCQVPSTGNGKCIDISLVKATQNVDPYGPAACSLGAGTVISSESTTSYPSCAKIATPIQQVNNDGGDPVIVNRINSWNLPLGEWGYLYSMDYKYRLYKVPSGAYGGGLGIETVTVDTPTTLSSNPPVVSDNKPYLFQFLRPPSLNDVYMFSMADANDANTLKPFAYLPSDSTKGLYSYNVNNSTLVAARLIAYSMCSFFQDSAAGTSAGFDTNYVLNGDVNGLSGIDLNSLGTTSLALVDSTSSTACTGIQASAFSLGIPVDAMANPDLPADQVRILSNTQVYNQKMWANQTGPERPATYLNRNSGTTDGTSTCLTMGLCAPTVNQFCQRDYGNGWQMNGTCNQYISGSDCVINDPMAMEVSLPIFTAFMIGLLTPIYFSCWTMPHATTACTTASAASLVFAPVVLAGCISTATPVAWGTAFDMSLLRASVLTAAITAGAAANSSTQAVKLGFDYQCTTGPYGTGPGMAVFADVRPDVIQQTPQNYGWVFVPARIYEMQALGQMTPIPATMLPSQ